ncbi:hypothetical protein QGP82_10110 [Leptothoe sp. LEGE 181152]|nr:hypothetical protein [Leptothoe sp. LEGE 181152]
MEQSTSEQKGFLAILQTFQKPDSGGLVEQFTGLTQGISLPQFSIGDTVTIPKLDALTGAVDRFTDLAQTLPSNPDDLLSGLLGELQGLADGSLEIETLMAPLTTSFMGAAPVLGEFQTMLEALTETVFPALSQLSEQTVDANYLSELLSVQSLSETALTQLSDVIGPYGGQVETLSQLLTGLTEESATEGFQTWMNDLVALPLDHQLTDEHLTHLEQQANQLTRQITRLEAKTQTAFDHVDQFEGTLANLSNQAMETLDTVLTKLDPHALGTQLNLLPPSALDILQQFDLSRILDQLQPAIATLENLVSQGVGQITAGIETVVGTIESAIATAEQALVKASALVTNLIQQIVDFIQGFDLTGLINQAKAMFNDITDQVSGVINQVNVAIGQVYGLVKGLIDKVAAFDVKTLISQFQALIARMTAVLEHPQVRSGLEQAKQGIDQVVQQLDEVSLQPIFDDVLNQVDTVKTTLASINVAELNQMLRTALSAALDLVRNAIDPPSQATDILKEGYRTQIAEPVLGGVIEPVKAQLDQVVDIINRFEPGTLVGELLTPPFEAMVAQVEALVDPDKLVELMQPISQFQADLLAKVDAVASPKTLLAPLVDIYQQLMGFVRSLSPRQLLIPINDLLHTVTQQLDKLGLETLVDQVVGSVRQVTDTISGFRLQDQPFWQPVQTILDGGITPFLETVVNSLHGLVDGLDLSALDPMLSPLRTAATTIMAQIREPVLLDQVKTVIQTVADYEKTYLAEITQLAQGWQQQTRRLNGANQIPAELQARYSQLQTQLQTLNPVTLLAIPTSLIDQFNQKLISILDTLERLWQRLTQRLDQGLSAIDNLVSNGVAGLKTYLNQAIDGLVAGPIDAITQQLEQPLAHISSAIQSILGLQEHLAVFNQIPDGLARIGQAMVGIKDKVQAFNLDFLAEPLQRVKEEVVKPLAALNPETALIAPLQKLYNKVRRSLERLAPAQLLATARGSITVTLAAPAANAIAIPSGTPLVATTPMGDIWFETLEDKVFEPGVAALEMPVQSLVLGRAGDVIIPEDVSWQVNQAENLPKELTMADLKQTAPILSLTTLVREVLLGKLTLFHPVELIAKPLNEQYQKIIQLKDELGIETLFDALFEKLYALSEEIETGVDKLGVSFNGLLAAMPL